jgi:hypothetical protein
LRERLEEKTRRPAQARAFSSLRQEIQGGATGVVVALARPPPSLEKVLPALSKLLGLSPSATQARLELSRPAILARLPEPEAEKLREQLAAEGLSVVLGDYSKLTHRGVRIRRFTLDEQSLNVESPKGEALQVRYQELRLLWRGQRRSTTTEVEFIQGSRTDRYREDYRDQVVRTEREHLENLLWIYGGEARLLVTEETTFEGLGARVASRAAAVKLLVEELRKRAPRMVVDERFIKPMRLMLPLVELERSLEVIAGLTDEAVREGLWP